MAARIEDYAMIGDCRSAALVARDGAVDWLCWPRFDSDACFAALLGDAANGRWRIAPCAPDARVERRYVDHTLVLSTRFRTSEGEVELVDFMPMSGDHPHLVRLVRGVSGRVAMRSDLTIRFEYGRIVPWVTREQGNALRAIAGSDMVVLRSSVPVHGERLASVADFEVGAGDCVSFVLSYGPSHLALPEAPDPQQALDETLDYWRRWANQCRDSHGEYGEVVERSHLTLKALTFEPTGGIVAAPTTSLPEQIGGPRNWDYRFCWLRDATFTLMSLLSAGYREEARAWREWLLRAVAGNPSQAQIMYGVDGRRRLDEWTVPWLSGYEGSQPVRIGNAAAAQLQIDVYGEVLDAFEQARRAGLDAHEAGWSLQRALVEHLETVWHLPDEGIWEVRGARRHFTHSKVMAWVALDRAICGIERYGLRGPLERWRALRERIHREVCEYGFDHELGSFVQAYGTKHLDASLLLMTEVGFLPPEDPRMRGTVAAIESRLMHHGFVLRYDTSESDDGLPPGEGAFLACSCWLADNYVLQGRFDDARALFERVLAVRNDVGLLAEEYDPVDRRQLGNFPQAFSHLAVADTARNLTQAKRPAEQRR